MSTPAELLLQAKNAKRVLVLGTSGAGKTTMAKFLAEMLNVPHLELDACFHEANWKRAGPEIFIARVKVAPAGGEWAVCGNYRLVREKLVGEADVIVWLDLSFPVVFSQVLVRTLR